MPSWGRQVWPYAPWRKERAATGLGLEAFGSTGVAFSRSPPPTSNSAPEEDGSPSSGHRPCEQANPPSLGLAFDSRAEPAVVGRARGRWAPAGRARVPAVFWAAPWSRTSRHACAASRDRWPLRLGWDCRNRRHADLQGNGLTGGRLHQGCCTILAQAEQKGAGSRGGPDGSRRALRTA